MRIQGKFIRTALYVGTAFCCTTFAFAQDASDRYVLRIDGGKLGKVVDDVHKQTDIEFIYSFDLVNADGINPINGKYTLDEALTIMFAGTGLSGGLTQSGMIVITREKSAQAQTQGEDEMISRTVKKSLLAGASALVIASTQTTAIAQEAAGAQASAVNAQLGQTGSIEGRVTYAGTDRPLIGAIVDLEGTNLSATTNRRGEYRFSVAPVGSHSLSIDYLGTENVTNTVTVRSNTKTTQNFSLGQLFDEVVVQAQRSSLMQSLNQQRAADNNSTVVSADILGAFPAETISEALRRVSGVTFSRDEDTGEGTQVSVRGFNSEAINVQLNGIDLQGHGVSRSVDLTGFLTENISQVTIHKSLLPSHEATGSGGLVEVETKSGLDYGDKYLSFGLEREGGFAGGFGNEFQANVTGAYKLTDNFGVVASLQYRDSNRENYDVSRFQTLTPVLPAGFTSLFRVPESYDFPFDAALPNTLQTGANYGKRLIDSKNITGALNFALDVSDHTTLRLDLQKIKSDVDLSRSRASHLFFTGSTDMPIPELGGEVRRRSYIRGFKPSLSLYEDSAKLETSSYSFRGETNLNEWEFDYKAGYTKTSNERERNQLLFATNFNSNVSAFISPSTIVTNPDDNAAGTLRVVGGAVSEVGDGISSLNLTDFGANFIADPSSYYLQSASFGKSINPSRAYIAELKTRRNFAHKNIEYIEVGSKFANVRRENSDDILSQSNIQNLQSLSRIFGRNTYLPDLLPSGLNSHDMSIIGAGDLSLSFLSHGVASDVFDAANALTVDDPTTPEREDRFRVRDTTGDPIEFSGAVSPSIITEKNIAGYVETKLKFGDLDVVGGVRYERNDRRGTAISAPSILRPVGGFEPRTTFVDLGLVEFSDKGGVDQTWTPSVLATYRPDEQIVARAGYNRSTINPKLEMINRPTSIFINLRSGFEKVTFTEANPDIVPSVTDNFDFDVAYYFKDNPGLFRAGFFYKKISNNFTSVALDDADASDLRARVLEQLAPLLATRPELLDFSPDTEFSLRRPINGEGGTVYGAELEAIRQLDFLPKSFPSFIENFSVLGNLTYTTSDFATLESARNDAGDRITLSLDRPFVKQSKWAGNASLRYEEGAFSGSVIYTYQSASASGYDEFNLNNIIPEFSTLDARVSYTIDKGPGGANILLFAEADNLLKGAKDADIRSGIGSQFGDGNADFFFPETLQFNGGRRFTVGARIKF